MTADPDRVRRIADADAGLPDPATAARVRTGAAADPAGAAVLDALAATRAELAALAPPPVPDEVATRWDAALAAAHADPEPDVPAARVARAGSAPPTAGRRDAGARHPRPAAAPGGRDGGGPRRRPRRRALVRTAAAALAAAAVTVGVLAGPQTPPPPAVARVDLAAAAGAAIGIRDLGPLADPARRDACLAAAGIGPVPPDRVLGGRSVVLDGTPGTLLVLATGELGRLRIIVVDRACGADGRGILLAETVTR